MEDLPRSPEEALDQLADREVVVADQNYTKPFYSGIDLLKEAAGSHYGIDVVLYTGNHDLGEGGLDIEHANELTSHNDSIEYIPKHGASSGMEELARAIDQALTETDRATKTPRHKRQNPCSNGPNTERFLTPLQRMLGMIHEDMSEADPEVHEALEKEAERQESEALEMIASENFVPRQVLQAQGLLMTNKYAEGLPGKRYYAGCEHHDTVENLARQRACDLFGADHANVQPHSGSTANFAAYFALLDQEDRVLGPSLDDGGHLTHGHPVNFSGELFDFDFYTLDSETGRFRREDVLEAARQHDPELIVTGFSAYPREFDFEMFAEVADEMDAHLMADVAHISGLVAADVHQQPFPHCDVVTTTTHKSIRGRAAA